jgi:alpha-N-arabinofuranosidase
MARPIYFEGFYRDLSALAHELAPGHSIGLAVNEWGLDLPESRQYSMDAALYGARLMNVFERSSPVVAMSAVSDMVNGWPGGIIQAGRNGVFVSPLYHVNRLYATHLGAERLRTSVESPTYDTNQEGRAIPALDAVATRSRDAKTIFIKLVNTDVDRELSVRLQIDGANVSASGERELLSSATPNAYNSFLTPNAIEPRHESIATGRNFTIGLPARSVSVVTLHVTQ